MNLEGNAECQYRCDKSKYTYTWSLNGSRLSDLQASACLLLSGPIKLQTAEFSFDAGWLKYTPNTFKLFLLVDKNKFVHFGARLTIGSPELTQFPDFTHAKAVVDGVSVTDASSESNLNFSLTETTVRTLPIEVRRNMFVYIRGKAWYLSLESNALKDAVSITFKFEFKFTFGRQNIPDTISHVVKTNEDTKPLGPLDLVSLFQTKNYADVKIFASNGHSYIMAHKLVLADRSPRFAAMFRLPFKESMTGEVHMENVEPALLYQFIQFLYLGEADFKNFATELCRVANQYFVENLKIQCENHLMTIVTNENVQELVQTADLYNLNRLKENCTKVIKESIKDIIYDSKRLQSFSKSCLQNGVSLSP